MLIGKGVSQRDAGGMIIAEVTQKGVAVDGMTHAGDPFAPANVVKQTKDVGPFGIEIGVAFRDELGRRAPR